jgi:ComF family protein
MFDSQRSSVNPRSFHWLTIAQNLTSLVAPPICALCGGAGQRADEIWGIDLCVHCEAACSRPVRACARCAEPLGEAAYRAMGPCVSGDIPALLCERCRATPPDFDATFALFRYEDPVDEMITALKFRGELGFARVLGTLLARHMRDRGPALPEALIPMPLHPSRLRERGFNQTEAIAAHAARRLRMKLDTRLLLRRRATQPQSGLSALDRAANLREAFAAADGRHSPARVALLDDVMTTGHTAAAAAMTLKEAGAQHVEIWACARAWLDAATG